MKMKLKHNLGTIRKVLEKSNSALETLEEIGRCEAELQDILKRRTTYAFIETYQLIREFLNIK